LRHIIVYNGGYVDNKFKRITGCLEKLNEPVNIERKYIERMMDMMTNIVRKIEKEIEQGKYICKCEEDDFEYEEDDDEEYEDDE